MKKKWLAAVLAGALLAAALLSGCSSVETVKRLRFGVAGEGGIYREFGERFAALENKPLAVYMMGLDEIKSG